MANSVANPVAAGVDPLASWSAEDVRLHDVLAALDELRRPETRPSTRTSVLSLVIVTHAPERAATALAAVHELGGRHPARTIVLLPQPGAGAGIDAEVRLMGSHAEGQAVWFEDVEMTVRGPAAAHLDSLIEPFTLPDLPVVCWFVDALPGPDDPLLTAADVVLVDARDFGDVECFATIAELVRDHPVVDLSWVRLRPWRELLAGLFEGHYYRPFVAGVTAAEVRGKTGPRHLLAGWLVERLGLAPGAVSLVGHRHAGIRLHATHDGCRAVFEVARVDEERVVVASARVEDGPSFETPLVLPVATPAWGLAEALSSLRRDTVYERALGAALTLG